MSSDATEHKDPWADHDHSGHTDDAWHSHTGEAPPQQSHGETSPTVIALVGIVGFVVLIATILIVTQYFDVMLQTEKVGKIEKADVRAEYRALQARWQEELSGYGWVDAQAGTVHIPVERAMSKVAQEYATTP